jgi:hypothetical protein
MRAIFLFIVLCLVIVLCGADYARRYPTNTPLEVMGVVATPAAPNAVCSVGQVSYDSNYIYVCTSTNTWGRATIAEWLVTRDLMAIEGVQMQIAGEDMQL